MLSVYFEIIIIVAVSSTTFICVFLIVYFLYQKKISNLRRLERRKAAGVSDNKTSKDYTCDGIPKKIILYMLKCSYNFNYSSSYFRITEKFVKNKELNHKNKILMLKANLPASYTNFDYREVQFRYSMFFMLIGFVVGSVFSWLLSFILCVVGLLIGMYAQRWALKKEIAARTISLERNMPEMFDIVALGLRSGLTFDRSLKIYICHFENQLSRSFMIAQKKWEGGLASRDEALRSLSSAYDCPLFNRVIENIIRSLRFGSSLAQNFEDAAAEARTLYKSKQEEKVAKAPVKMMIPTGTLILPAMLILVLGPILLELINGF